MCTQNSLWMVHLWRWGHETRRIQMKNLFFKGLTWLTRCEFINLTCHAQQAFQPKTQFSIAFFIGLLKLHFDINLDIVRSMHWDHSHKSRRINVIRNGQWNSVLKLCNRSLMRIENTLGPSVCYTHVYGSSKTLLCPFGKNWSLLPTPISLTSTVNFGIS